MTRGSLGVRGSTVDVTRGSLGVRDSTADTTPVVDSSSVWEVTGDMLAEGVGGLADATVAVATAEKHALGTSCNDNNYGYIRIYWERQLKHCLLYISG